MGIPDRLTPADVEGQQIHGWTALSGVWEQPSDGSKKLLLDPTQAKMFLEGIIKERELEREREREIKSMVLNKDIEDKKALKPEEVLTPDTCHLLQGKRRKACLFKC